LKKVKLNLASDRYEKDQTHLLRNPYIPKSSSHQQSKTQIINNRSFKSEPDQDDDKADDKENEQTLNTEKPKVEGEEEEQRVVKPPAARPKHS